MGKENNHTLLKAYFKEHSLIDSNIRSFNNFIEVKMQRIINTLNKDLEKEESPIKLGKIEVGYPNIIEADGSKRKILPIEARIRKVTYSAPVKMEIGINQGNIKEQGFVEIGRIPIMIKSKRCNLNSLKFKESESSKIGNFRDDKTQENQRFSGPKEFKDSKESLGKEELAKNYEDNFDHGGYFIINGNERILVMVEDLAPNHPFIEDSSKGIMLRLFSQRRTYTIPVSLQEAKDGIINLSFSRFKNIPAILLVKAFGVIKDSEIAGLIGKQYDTLLINLYEFAQIKTEGEAFVKIAEIMGMEGTKKEILDKIMTRIDSFFLPHIGTEKNKRKIKAKTLCKLIKQYFLATKEKGRKVITDKDHYANKRVRLSGDLLTDLFRVNLTIFVRDMQHTLQKVLRRKKLISIKTIAKGTLFSHRFESAIATGNWIGERTGITQNMDKTNCLSIISQLQRVVSQLTSTQENFKARTLHPTHYGKFCPTETPEGQPIGLRKNLALLCKISTEIYLDEKKFIETLKKFGLEEENEKGEDVFINGKFSGTVKNHLEFLNKIKETRRKGEIPSELSIKFDQGVECILINTEVGRAMRPLIIVENGKSKITKEILEAVEKDELTWMDLINKGLIEYVDSSEESNLYIAINEEELTKEHTHLEIDPIAMFGAITSLVPFANHNQSSRLMRGSKTQKQALGIYSTNFLSRVDTDVSILHYPQKPIVRSKIYDLLNFYPVGQNVVVAIMPLDGYNIEDSIVMNKASIERGLGRSSYFRPYTSIELNYAGGLRDEIAIPSKDVSGYRIESVYRYLEKDGIVFPEADLKENEVVIGKTSPPKFLSDMGGMAIIKSRKENSLAIRQEEKGTVDGVFITVDGEGNKVIHVRTRDLRIPELGDKFATPHGQKGVLGMIVPEENLPFTSKGIRPDIIFNPHGIPSRMTVGYLIELLAGKVAALSGKVVDGTAFAHKNVKEIEEELLKLGFRPDGKENFYNGLTGKPMEAKIYIGNMYYLKLKYMVGNKIHARASGKVQLLTRQPIEGRAKGGALRLGEMEKDALIAHGSSLLLKERFSSDNVIVYICENCGSIGIRDRLRKRDVCLMCNNAKLKPIQISYASKLLLEELIALHIFPKITLKSIYE